jgi:hypothetical protein
MSYIYIHTFLCKPIGFYSKPVGLISLWVGMGWVETIKIWDGWVKEES